MIIQIFPIFFFVCLFLIIYNLFIYPVLLKVIIIFYKNKTNSKNIGKIAPKVSLIITAHNEEQNIENKIKNSFELDYPNRGNRKKLEIIVVSDGSTDDTNRICKKYETKKQIKFIEIDQRIGKVNALNHAVPEATGEILVFSDANTFYNKDAIKQLVKHFNDEKVGCVTGYVRLIAKKGLHKQGEIIFTTIERNIQKNESLIHSVIGIDGAMYSLRKKLYIQSSAFFSNLLIEDFVVGMDLLRRGYRVIYEPKAKAWEISSISISEEFKRKSRIVAGAFQSLRFIGFLFTKPLLLFEFISHKLLRWLTVELLIVMFVLNLFLLKDIFFMAVFGLQLLFYLAALAGWFIKPFSFINYFVVMQLASLWGLIKYLFNIQKVTWARTKRL